MRRPSVSISLFPMAGLAALLSSGAPVFGAPTPAGPVRFNRDIRPVLSENCFHCHGPDSASRKADLRLDLEQGFFEKTADRDATIVKGNPDASPLYQRIMTTDVDDVMPPPESHNQLEPEEKALIGRWIAEGAAWQPHWSFLKPERPAIAEKKDDIRVRNPIDALVLAKLAEQGLSPAPEAERRTLARRLSLDLTGVTPAPDAVEAFVNDGSPDFYERYIKTLMDSPRWGEHRARYWLDAARYGDTHGLHFDNYREMWPYRDWVIRAFNANMPFDKFTVEQLAGDLLPNPSMDQLVATGFQRCNITTNEGGTIVEENLANYARDRVETTSWVFLGLTANCAVCHDHKFDPITAKDFYSMAAFFRNTTQPGLDGNVKDSTPSIVVPQTEEDIARWAAIPGEITGKQTALAQRRQEAAPEFERWIAEAKAEDAGQDADPAGLVAQAPLTEGAGDEINALCGAPMKFKATGPVLWKPDGKIGPAPVIQAKANFDLGNQGDFEKDQPFSYGAWVKAPGNNGFAGIIARMDEGAAYRGWDLWLNGAEFAVHFVNTWPENAMKIVTQQSAVKPGQWQHVFVSYDGSGKAGGLKIHVDGVPAQARVEVDNLRDTIRTTVPLRIGQRSNGSVFEGGSVQDLRVYSRRLPEEEVRRIFQSGPLRSMLAVDPDKRTPEQKEALFTHYLTTRDATWTGLQRNISDLEGERAGIRERSPVTHIQTEKMDSAPVANILTRGNYDQLGEKVESAVFHALHPLPANAPNNRLGLAEWLTAKDNPLTARVTVNRLWQEIFGTGIVKTSEDFGLMGEAPANQDLLDWLAVEFMESGWNVKHMVSLMVSSATYRQSAAVTPEKLEKDLANRLLSRGPRFRMDGEMLRDSALAASGLMVAKIGGAPVKPYQPEGVWDKVGMVEGNTRIYKQDTGEGLYRRSLYTFWKRMAPPPSLEIFNAPSRELSCLRRERTDTPLQALVTLNDPQFIEAGRVLAQQSLLAAAGDDDRALDLVSLPLLSRTLSPIEREIVKATLADTLAHYRAEPALAAQLIAVGETKADPAVDAPTLAAWTMVANQLINLDEALNK